MSRSDLWRISVTTTPEAEDAVAELISDTFGRPASIHTLAETGVTTVSVYCETRPREFGSRRKALRAGLRRIERCGLRIGPGRVQARPIRRENWAESWKRHFKPLSIAGALLLKPSWSQRRAKPGQAVVVLDPGLSFGTGHHPTTAYCLRELVRRRRHDERQSLLDIGTGSGILAIAAAKLGYAPVHAFDVDPESVRIARANARANAVSARIRTTRQDLGRLPAGVGRRYDLICANLISHLLTAEGGRIVGRLAPGGVLIAAGILRSEFPAVRRFCNALGLRLIASRIEREWQSGTFRLAPPGRRMSRPSWRRPIAV